VAAGIGAGGAAFAAGSAGGGVCGGVRFRTGDRNGGAVAIHPAAVFGSTHETS